MPTDNPIENRDELIDLFVVCANVAEPEHPYVDDPYPITRNDLKVGWCRIDGPYWAKCGPGRGITHIALFSPCTDELLSMDYERMLAIITHELAHITEGSHSEGPVHNKAFWREMAFIAWMIREGFDEIEEFTGVPVDEEVYITEVIHEPNSFTVDGRIETVEERRIEMAELLGETEEDALRYAV